MKKLIGLVAVILVILVGILGYKVVYKVSPRDFITRDTRVIYANESINNKDFSPILSLIDDKGMRENIESNLKNLKYVSKFYIFSDKEFYELDEKSFTGVLDTGYWYYLILKDLNEYFNLVDDIYVMKSEVKNRYFSNLKGDIYLKPYKGVFILSLGEKNLKDFIAKDGKYLYNKEIEDTLDTERDNLFGTFIYNNSGTDFYGVNLLTNSATMKNGIVVSQGEIILNEKESTIFKSTKEDRELVKYLDRNTLYLSVDDFSKLDRFIFNPFVVGSNVDSRAILAFWKNLLGIDVEEMLKEIDGEIIFNLEDNSFMISLKESAPEIRKVVNMLKDDSSAFYTSIPLEERDGILTIGNREFKKNTKPIILDRGTFIHGDFDLGPIFDMGGIKSSIQGSGRKIKVSTEIPSEDFKRLLNIY